MNLVLFIFGIICIVYDFSLIIQNPGTFLDNVTSFSHIWLLIGGYHIFLAIYRRKNGHSFWKIWPSLLKKITLLCCSFGVVFSVVSLFFILNPKIIDDDENCDYVLVLGGGIDKNGTLPQPVQDRVDVAAEFLKKHEEAVCVVTGGTLKWLPYAEAPEIKKQLVNRGISSERILVEDKALDTIQNLQYSCQILSDYSEKSIEEILNSKIVLVSSKYHLRRAQRLAKRLGFQKISGMGSKCPVFFVAQSYLREILAYLKLNLRILFTGEPSKIIG